MAVTPTPNNNAGGSSGEVISYTWTLTTANPTGIGVMIPGWSDKTWTISGTLGSSVTTIQGSFDDVDANYSVLTDIVNTALTFAALPACKMQAENPMHVRPKLTTAGSGATVVVSVVGVRPTNLRT